MSQENVEVTRRMFDAFGRGDLFGAAEPLHPDMEMDTTRAPVAGLAGIYKGLEEVAQFWLEWLEAWGEQEIDEPEFIDAGDRVLMWTTGHRLRGRGSGVEVAIPTYGWVATFRDGKVVHGTMYMDKAEALEAAGLSE